MPRWQRVYVAACAGVIAYALGYVLVSYARVPHPTYYQHAREWRMDAVPSSPLPSGYVGMWLWALIAALVTAAAAWLVLRWRRRPLSDRALGLGLAWAMTAVAVAGGYYTWNNWP